MNESQPERTRLAWRRTVLVAGVVALLLVRSAVEQSAAWLVPASAGVWLVAAVTAQRRIRALATEPPPAAGREITVAVLLTMGYAAMGTAALLLP